MTTTNGDKKSQGRLRLVDEPDLRLEHVHAEPLAVEITALLGRLTADTMTFVIVEVGAPEANRYLQFLTYDGTTMIAESVGDENLEPGYGLSGNERRQLLRLGWNPPEDDRHAGNYWRTWEPPNVFDAGQLAALTLLGVHNLTSPSEVRVIAAEAQPPVGHD